MSLNLLPKRVSASCLSFATTRRRVHIQLFHHCQQHASGGFGIGLGVVVVKLMGEVILCNDCKVFALKSGRLAVVKMTFTVPVSAARDRRKTEVSFCVKITQNEKLFRPCLCRMNKHPANASCVSHTPLRSKCRSGCLV